MEINDVKKYLVYATSAMRGLKQRGKIVESLANETGIKIKIISGRRNQRLLPKIILVLISEKVKIIVLLMLVVVAQRLSSIKKTNFINPNHLKLEASD